MRLISYMSPGLPPTLFVLLAQEMESELHFETRSSGPTPGVDPFAEGSFDLGWICSTSFVDLGLRKTKPSIQIVGVAWVPDDADAAGRPVYFGDLVVRPEDKRISSVADLKGRRVGCNDLVSLSGHHALRFAFEDLGVDVDTFTELVFTGGHHASLDALLAGNVDAAVVDSVVRIGRGRSDPLVAELRIVDRLGPWPVQPLVARSDINQTEITRLRNSLIAANNEPAVKAALEAAALTGFVEIGVNHYDSVKAAIEGRPLKKS